MAKHEINYQPEFRKGMRESEIRVTCSCGNFEDKAQTEQGAKSLAGKHLQDVVNQIRPQQKLDL